MNAVVAPRFFDLAPGVEGVRGAVLDGLARTPKELPAWLFYDAAGSKLFERICEQPEYYPTRTELGIFRTHGREIAEALGEGCCLIELGSGSNRKARTLLQVLLRPEGYVAIDVSGDQLRCAVRELAAEFPLIPMTGIVGDYGGARELPLGDATQARRVAFFPGSTIGNMHPHEARDFLAPWAARLAGGGMLVGVDLVKPEAVLHAAYNDAAGVTAAFNRNVLRRANRELGADFLPERFAHDAFWHEGPSRIEMHLVSRGRQRVVVGGRAFDFRDGESIHTENSYKYTVEGFRALARDAGFVPGPCWTDPQGWFSVHFLAAPSS
jgi:dimethylhistidine N-methyltransferase